MERLRRKRILGVYDKTIDIFKKHFDHDPYKHSLKKPTFDVKEFMHSMISSILRDVDVSERERDLFQEWWQSKESKDILREIEDSVKECTPTKARQRKVEVERGKGVREKVDLRGNDRLFMIIAVILSHKLNTAKILENPVFQDSMRDRKIPGRVVLLVKEILKQTPVTPVHSFDQSLLFNEDPSEAISEALHAFLSSYKKLKHGRTLASTDHVFDGSYPEKKRFLLRTSLEEIVENGIVPAPRTFTVKKSHENMFSVYDILKRGKGKIPEGKDLFLLGLTCLFDPNLEKSVTSQTDIRKSLSELMKKHIIEHEKDSTYLEGKLREYTNCKDPNGLYFELKKLFDETNDPKQFFERMRGRRGKKEKD